MSTLDRSRATESRRLAIGMAVVVPAVALMEAVYYFGGVTGTRDDTPLRAATIATIIGALAALAVWRFGRRAYAQARATRLWTVLAVVSVLGFWIGITFPVSLAAVLFGRAALDAGAQGRGRAAQAAGVLALAAAAVLCVLGAS